jgi:hypothetical protein
VCNGYTFISPVGRSRSRLDARTTTILVQHSGSSGGWSAAIPFQLYHTIMVHGRSAGQRMGSPWDGGDEAVGC